jgi:hypothetical protein
MSTTPKADAATYDFSAKIPKYPDLKSSGEIKNVTAILNQTVTVPRRVGDVNGQAKVDVCHPKITNITLLFIQPSEHSTGCWKLICRPAGSYPPDTSQKYPGETGKGGYESGGSYPPDTSQKYPGETGKGGYESGGSYPPDTSQKYPGETGKREYPKINPPPPPKYLAGTECDFTWNNPDDPSEGGYFTVPNDPKDKRKGVRYIPYQGQQTQTMPPPATAAGETRPRPPQPPGPISTPGSVEINLENDLFLIGHSVIGLLGAVNSLEFENALDKEVSIQIVMGYPVDWPSIRSETGSKMQ